MPKRTLETGSDKCRELLQNMRHHMILRSTPSVSDYRSREEGCVVVSLLCQLISSSSALLGLLVVCRFEYFGSLVKCAEASWLLEFGVFVSIHLKLFLWTRILLFWVSKTQHLVGVVLHFPTLEAILSAWGHLGGPWAQHQGHVKVWNQIFNETGVVWGPHFYSCLVLDLVNYMFFRLLSKSLFASVFEWNY